MISILPDYKPNNTCLFVGIGNVLKHDDGVGVYISQNIIPSRYIKALAVEQSIENYIGKINSINPDVLVLIDCVDFNQSPGYYKVIPIDNLSNRTSGTHNISLNSIKEFFNMSIFILGIQPKIVSFGEGLSAEVKQAAKEIISSVS